MAEPGTRRARKRHASIVQCTAQRSLQPRRLQSQERLVAIARRLLQRRHQRSQTLLQACTSLFNALCGARVEHLHEALAQLRVDGGALAIGELRFVVGRRIVGGEDGLQHDDVSVGGDANGGVPLDGVQYFDVNVRYVGIKQREFVLQRAWRLGCGGDAGFGIGTR